MKGALVLAVLAVGLVAVSAYCPNLCSGHGTCGNDDKCDCYKQVGTDSGGSDSDRAAWQGADCSLRTCPVAVSWSGSAPSGHAVEVAITHTGHKIEGTGFNTDIKRGSEVVLYKDGVDPIHATVYSVTGTVIITYQYLGVDGTYDKMATQNTDANAPSKDQVFGVHAKSECAGQGICDRATGSCNCFAGYEGESCTRTSCPADCSGHGVCLSLYRLSDDAADEREGLAVNGDGYANHGKRYAGWDANKEYGCKCDSGFRGPACDQIECPSTVDPMNGCGGGICNAENTVGAECTNNDDSKCTSNEQRDCSGRGLCDYTTGLCTCFSGFYGEACETQTILV